MVNGSCARARAAWRGWSWQESLTQAPARARCRRAKPAGLAGLVEPSLSVPCSCAAGHPVPGSNLKADRFGSALH